MIRHIDGYHIAAEVRLLRQMHKGAILIVEGGDDARVFDRFLDRKICKTQVAFGRKNAIDALDRLEEDGFPGVAAVIDADFDRLLGISHALDGLCVTDAHDLDLTIFCSDALNHYLREHADDALFEKNFGRDPNAVRRAIIDACKPIACCRLASERSGLRLNFQDIELDTYINVATLTVDADGVFRAVIAQSAGAHTLGAVKALVAKEELRNHDLAQLTNGHDVSAVLGIALRRMLGSRRDVHTWAREIEAGMRLGFDSAAFSTTDIYRFLRDWEARSKYAVF